jgi:fluoroacetyl-CoA thioesterase
VSATLTVGLTGERSLVVQEEHTAARWGSGSLLVFSTPQMIALMEGAAVDAVDPLLPAGYQTVGTHIHVDHLAATPLGRRVRAVAELVTIEGRKLTFRVAAYDEVGKIGEGEHHRFTIEVAKFIQRAEARSR